MNAWLHPTMLAGAFAILVGCVDHFAAHDAFGLLWDQALILGGLTWMAGVAVPGPFGSAAPPHA